MTPRIIFEVHVYLYLETSRVIFNNSEMTFYLQSLAVKSYIHVELIDLLHMYSKIKCGYVRYMFIHVTYLHGRTYDTMIYTVFPPETKDILSSSIGELWLTQGDLLLKLDTMQINPRLHYIYTQDLSSFPLSTFIKSIQYKRILVQKEYILHKKNSEDKRNQI